MLILSMIFVPSVSAKADLSQNAEDYFAAIDTSKFDPLSEKEMKIISENVKVLKETDTKKISSFTKDDGSIGYAISWKDKKNSEKVYFTIIDQDELVSSDILSASSLNDDVVVAEAISIASTSFWHGSYIEQYGNSITGGIYIHFSATDASYVANVGTLAAGAIASVLGLLLSPAASIILGALVAIAVQTFYWYEQNSDGSLDISVPFANIATMILLGNVYMKIGDHWYTIDS